MKRYSHLATRLSALLLFGVLACADIGRAQTHPQRTSIGEGTPHRLLFVGNSFFYWNYGINAYVERMARSTDAFAGQPFRGILVAIGGAGLDWHDVDSYFRPQVGSYRVGRTGFEPDKFDKPFDAVILQDCSQCPVHPQLKPTFHASVRKHAATIRAHGAVPVLFMTWAYADKPEMTAQLATEYTKAGNDNDVLVVPVGLAFARSLAERPDVDLYWVDKEHPSIAGTYLAAATVYASIYGRSPLGIPVTSNILDPAVVTYLQKVAWETVNDYYKR